MSKEALKMKKQKDKSYKKYRQTRTDVLTWQSIRETEMPFAK